MIHWVIKIFAFLTVVALIIGMAAECVTTIGDLKSVGTTPTSNASTFGIMLAKASNSKNKGAAKPKAKPIVCEAYKYGTDFNQRSAGVFGAAVYHLLTLIAMTILLVQQAMRGLSPGSLGSIYRFVPAISGGWGLSGTGGFTIYVSLQILSYSVGKVHIIAALLLFLVGILNLGAGFYSPIASCEGLDPSGDGMMAGGAYAMDPSMGGGGGAGMDPYGGGPAGGGGMGMGDPNDAPDPYDGKDPDAPGGGGGGLAGYDGTDGVGASAPPPGVIANEGKTYGNPPPETVPLNGYGQMNSETNPQLLAQGAAYNGGGGAGTSEVVFDPASGMWNTIFHPAPVQTTVPIQQPAQAMLPGMPIGYDAFGRPIMGAPSLAMQGGMMHPGLLQQPQAAITTEETSSSKTKDPKKLARKEARRAYEKLRAEEEEASESAARKRARKKEREQERLLRKREKEYQRQAREIAEQDAKERMVKEEAEDDARKRQSREMMNQRRAKAIQDARKQALGREKAYREEEMQEQERQRIIRMEEEEEYAMQQRREMQARALGAAQEAARLGEPLPGGDRDSHLSRSSTVPNNAYSRPQSEYFQDEPGYPAERVARRRSSSVPLPSHPGFNFQHPAGLLPAVPLAPFPGQSSHLSVSPAAMAGSGPPQLPPLARQQTRFASRDERDVFGYETAGYDEEEMLQGGERDDETASEKELLWIRMQEERERVIARQQGQQQGGMRKGIEIASWISGQSRRERDRQYPVQL